MLPILIPHENVIQNTQLERLKQRIFSTYNSLVPCFVYPYNYFLQKHFWCLGQIIPPLLQSTVVYLPKKHSLILPLRCYHVCVTSQTIKSFYYNDNTKGRVMFPSFIAIEIFYCKYLRAFFIYILLSYLEVDLYCIFKSLVNKIHRIIEVDRFRGSRNISVWKHFK